MTPTKTSATPSRTVQRAATTAEPGTLAAHWADLVTVALLGTDRRPAPHAPPGPLADLVAACEPPDDATSVLVQAAATATVRRAGLRPLPSSARLRRPEEDTRPLCPPAAARRLGEVVEAWPILLGEWLDALDAAGLRLPPEHLVTLLTRFRNDPRRRRRVERSAGPVAAWLAELFPDLGVRRGRDANPPANEPAVTAVPSDLAPLLDLPQAEMPDAVAALLEAGGYVARHRPLLVRLVCSLPVEALAATADALRGQVTVATGAALAAELADLAQTRAEMLAELRPLQETP